VSSLSSTTRRRWPFTETDCDFHSFSPTYDNDEPEYDPEEPEEPDVDTAHVDDIDIGENPDQLLLTGDSSRGVISSGDPTAAADREKGPKAAKDKRIPNEKRTTTPYMTKYERARILGTRALQIR
jgi:DNA-directed RNA polymerase I, II, and III subunit RPABC2